MSSLLDFGGIMQVVRASESYLVLNDNCFVGSTNYMKYKPHLASCLIPTFISYKSKTRLIYDC